MVIKTAEIEVLYEYMYRQKKAETEIIPRMCKQRPAEI